MLRVSKGPAKKETSVVPLDNGVVLSLGSRAIDRGLLNGYFMPNTKLDLGVGVWLPKGSKIWFCICWKSS